MSSHRPLALLASGVLGASAALLASCGSAGKLIPVASSEPLQKDFQEVASAAEAARGSCASTVAALSKAEQDLSGLPASVDAGLRRRLGEGLSKLRSDALELCAQPSVASTATSTPRTTSTATQPTSTTSSAPTNTNTQTTQGTTNTTGPGGGTPAKEGEGEGAGEAPAQKRKGGGTEPEAGAGAPSGGGGEGGK